VTAESSEQSDDSYVHSGIERQMDKRGTTHNWASTRGITIQLGFVYQFQFGDN